MIETNKNKLEKSHEMKNSILLCMPTTCVPETSNTPKRSSSVSPSCI